MRDKAHLAFLRGLPCAMCLAPPPSDAHHSTSHPRGLGLKSGDEYAFPLCHTCHMEFHDKKGRFYRWGKEERKMWERIMADLYRGKHEPWPPKEPTDDSEPF